MEGTRGSPLIERRPAHVIEPELTPHNSSLYHNALFNLTTSFLVSSRNMSSREPMWYCHEVSFQLTLPSPTHRYCQCHSEMRPLMVCRNPPKPESSQVEQATIFFRSPIPIVHLVMAPLWRRLVGLIYLLPHLIQLLFCRSRARRMIHAASRRQVLLWTMVLLSAAVLDLRISSVRFDLTSGPHQPYPGFSQWGFHSL